MEDRYRDILNRVKQGNPYMVSQDVNLFGEVDYEEWIFYVENKDVLFRQMIDWMIFPETGFNTKKTFCFDKITDFEALLSIKKSLEDMND